MTDLKEHLTTLSQLHAPSGHEGAVRAYLKDAWAEYVDEMEVDGLGSLIGIKRGMGSQPRKRIMLSAHMDEIGMIVSEVRDGFLRVDELGGIDGRTLQGKSVIVHGQRQLIGTVAAVPPHISKDTGDGRKKYPGLRDQWIDLGLPAEEVAELVRVGDIVTMDADLVTLKGDVVAGKAMDDRASVAAVTLCLEILQKRIHEWDVYAVASTQEEVGLYGAKTAAHHVAPDLAIAIDVGFGAQPGISDDSAAKLGSGIQLGLGPNFHPGWRRFTQWLGKDLEIPLLTDVLSGASGTDAWAIQVARSGVPTILFSIPIRNMHSTVETVSLKDIRRTGRLMAELITALSDDTLDALDWRDNNNGSDEESDNESEE